VQAAVGWSRIDYSDRPARTYVTGSASFRVGRGGFLSLQQRTYWQEPYGPRLESIADLSSPLRVSTLTEGRIEFTLLAVTRFALRSSDLAALLNKHPSSLTRWLNEGLRRERDDCEFRDRINKLDAAISSAASTMH